jgi:hypothetical protein
MPGLLEVLDTRLVERWLQTLLPGFLFIAAAGCGLLLRGHSALDVNALADAAGALVNGLNSHPPALVLAIAAAGITATAVALANEEIAGVVHRVFTANRPGYWVKLRRARANSHADRPTLDRYLPSRTTHIGDRFHRVGERAEVQYGVDATLAWPRLWLLLSDPALARIQTAYRQYQSATNACAWGLVYLALSAMWWPTAVVGLVLVVLGYRRARTSAATLADLIEAAIDIELRGLAQALGIALPHHRVTRDEGAQINNILNKRA